jgi:hypothetical protein
MRQERGIGKQGIGERGVTVGGIGKVKVEEGEFEGICFSLT